MPAKAAVETVHCHEQAAGIFVYEIGGPVEGHLSRTGHRTAFQACEVVAGIGAVNRVGGSFIVTAHGVKFSTHDDIPIGLGSNGRDEAGLCTNPPDRMRGGVRITLVKHVDFLVATDCRGRRGGNVKVVRVLHIHVIDRAAEQAAGQTLPSGSGISQEDDGVIVRQSVTGHPDFSGRGFESSEEIQRGTSPPCGGDRGGRRA